MHLYGEAILWDYELWETMKSSDSKRFAGATIPLGA